MPFPHQPHELPLQSRPRPSPLAHYIPQDQSSPEPQANFPCQLADHSYQNRPTNNRIPTISNHSLSKWAFTEMSTQDPKDDDSITPTSQGVPWIAPEPTSDCMTPELMGEATFKPKELKEHLRGNHELKKILKQALGSDRLKEGKPKREPLEKRERGKTRYQKVLEEYFQKDKAGANKAQLKTEKGTSLREKYSKQECDQNLHPSSSHLRRQKSPLCPSKSFGPQASNRGCPQKQSQKLLPTWRQSHQVGFDNKQSNRLTKTYSQQALRNVKQEGSNPLREYSRGKEEAGIVREGWLRMSFTERQKRVLDSRKEKENQGKQLNMERQIRECSFKPLTTAYHGSKVEQTAGSYAKLYLERLRKQR